MVPLSAETGGRLDATFSKFLKEVVTSGLDFGESPVTSLDQRDACSLCITLALCARGLFICHRTLRCCKCSHSWVEDYRTVPRALGCRPI